MPTDTEAPPRAVDTPKGRLHRPLGAGWQVLVLVAAFLAGPAIGWAVGRIPGDLSETAQTLVQAPFVLVFFLGYAAWVARLKVIAFQGLGWPILKALIGLVLRRERPRSLEDVVSRESLLEMAVKAQAAAAAFRRVGWLLGIAAGLVAALFDSATAGSARFLLVATTCVAWGYALAFLGRRGWLPIMEGN